MEGMDRKLCEDGVLRKMEVIDNRRSGDGDIMQAHRSNAVEWVVLSKWVLQLIASHAQHG